MGNKFGNFRTFEKKNVEFTDFHTILFFLLDKTTEMFLIKCEIYLITCTLFCFVQFIFDNIATLCFSFWFCLVILLSWEFSSVIVHIFVIHYQ